MAYPAVQELDALLQSLQTLKPPGVNKPKVDTATKICMELQNIPVRPSMEPTPKCPNIFVVD